MGHDVRRLIILGLLALAVGGCSTTYRLPAVSEAEIAAATSEIRNSDALKPVQRSESEARQLVDAAVERLQRAAGPVCGQVGYEPCVFHVRYDHDDSTPNAWASGENEITITGGMVRYLHNEEEIAAVIGHEMGHHIVGHIDSGTTRVVLGQIFGAILGAGAAIALDADPTTTALAAGAGGTAGAYTGMIVHSKEDEREADYISVYLLARAGYDLETASGVWTRLAKASGRDLETGMLDTHPASPDRLAAWRRAMDEVAQDDDLLPNE
jgi:predicted Zn-dependent protease